MNVEIWAMNSLKYNEWVKTLKEGDLVLLLETNAIYSAPVIFLTWDGDSLSSGYRAQHLYIPNWNKDHYWYGSKDDPQAAANHMVLGLDLEQRQKARGKTGRSGTPTWI